MPIFYFDCEHVHFVYIVKQNKQNLRILTKKNFVDFQNFQKFNENRVLIETKIEILIIHKPSLGSREFHKKFGPDRLSCFDAYWIQTNRQTSKVYI